MQMQNGTSLCGSCLEGLAEEQGVFAVRCERTCLRKSPTSLRPKRSSESLKDHRTGVDSEQLSYYRVVWYFRAYPGEPPLAFEGDDRR